MAFMAFSYVGIKLFLNYLDFGHLHFLKLLIIKGCFWSKILICTFVKPYQVRSKIQISRNQFNQAS